MSHDYYRTIKGKKYDRQMLELADEAVAETGEENITLEGAGRLIESVKDANKYTRIEKTTMRYIRDNYRFTPEADQWFRTEIRRWAGRRGWLARLKGEKTARPAAGGAATAPAAAVGPPPAVRVSPEPATITEAVTEAVASPPEAETPIVHAAPAAPAAPITPPTPTTPPPFQPPPRPSPAAFSSAEPERSRSGLGWKAIAAAAVVVLIVLAGYFLMRPGTQPEQPPLAQTEAPPPAQASAPSAPPPAQASAPPAPPPQQAAIEQPPAPRPQPQPQAAPQARPAAPAGTRGGTHTVVAGDSLWTIADEWYRDARLWPNVYRVNREQIADPDLIRPAMRVTVPPLEGSAGELSTADQSLTAAGYASVFEAYRDLNKRKAAPYLIEAGRRDPTLAEKVREELRKAGR